MNWAPGRLRAIRRRPRLARQQTDTAAGRLESLSPLAVLGRGYSLTQRHGRRPADPRRGRAFAGPSRSPPASPAAKPPAALSEVEPTGAPGGLLVPGYFRENPLDETGRNWYHYGLTPRLRTLSIYLTGRFPGGRVRLMASNALKGHWYEPDAACQRAGVRRRHQDARRDLGLRR